jgi:nitrite reductase/ring-hydroxylating ferredoxin subunit
MAKVKIGETGDFAPGQMKDVNVQGKVLLVANADGHLYAIEGRCSHMGFPLAKGTFGEKQVRCKMHGAIFDLETGKVLGNPQARDLRVYPVVIEGQEVYVDL